MMPAKRWQDDEVKIDVLKDQKIAVLGYGIQGRAQACNMRDSGIDVVVGLRRNSKGWESAKVDGQDVMEMSEAAEVADIVHFLIPDMEQAEVYLRYVCTHLRNGDTLSFSHGAAVHWGWIFAPKTVDVVMVAPKGPGQLVRELYLQGFGTPSLVAVHQDFTKKAWDKVLAIAKSIGSTKPGVLQTSFQEEVETDWFGEQADLCGGVHSLIMSAFDTLVESGYQPEVAYFECLHELKLIVDLVYRYGLTGMYNRVSETARYGGLTRGTRVIGNESRKKMKEILDEIRSGEFANEWITAYKKEGRYSFDRYMKEIENHQLEKVGRELRGMMWRTIEK